MKRILMMTNNGSLMDGINRHILTVAPALNELDGVEVGVCINHPQGELHEALREKGVKCWSLGYTNGHKPGIYRALDRVMKTFKPDVVHTHVMPLVAKILLSRKYKHLAYVVTTHGIGDAVLTKVKEGENQQSANRAKKKKSLKSRIEEWLNQKYPIHYDARCFISAGVRERLIRPESVNEFTPVCYNPMRFDVIPKKKYALHKLIGVENDVPIIGTSCRVAEVKQLEIFTELICYALQKNKALHAVIIGNGDTEILKLCEDIVSQYNLKDRVHFLGYRVDGPELVCDMDCFVLTSRSEGMPTSVLECFASGVPVAMLRGEGGLRDIDVLNSEDRPIVTITDRDDIEGLAKGIIRILEDKDYARVQARNAFEVGREQFDVRSVATQLNEIYDMVLGEYNYK